VKHIFLCGQVINVAKKAILDLLVGLKVGVDMWPIVGCDRRQPYSDLESQLLCVDHIALPKRREVVAHLFVLLDIISQVLLILGLIDGVGEVLLI